MVTAAPKVTYISLSADDPALDAAFDAAIAGVRSELGKSFPLRVAVARVATAGEVDVRDAVAAAKAAFPRWSATPWQERAAIIDRAADLIRSRKFELGAWLIQEMGKNRVEALGEIEETADLCAYYSEELRAN